MAGEGGGEAVNAAQLIADLKAHPTFLAAMLAALEKHDG